MAVAAVKKIYTDMRQSCKLEDRNTTLDDGKKGVNSRT
jgi:hypothetical protein